MADKLIRTATLTEIADAIRMKTDTADPMAPGQMADLILQTGFSNIPAHHAAAAMTMADKIAQIRDSGASVLVFGVITDSHVNVGTDYEPLTRTSARHGAYALETVSRWAGCDFLANLGDNCWGTCIDAAEDAAAARYLAGCISGAMANTSGYWLVGEHDWSADPEKIYTLNGIRNNFDVSAATASRGYGYTDHAAQKVRVIALNTSDCNGIGGGFGLSYEQKDFLIRALDLSGKSDADQWQILILSHFPLDEPDAGVYDTRADVQAILKAYRNGLYLLISVNSAYAAAENEDPSTYATYKNGRLAYNYAGKNSASIIACFHGHVHNTCYGTMADCGVLRVASPNSCFYLENTSSASLYGTSTSYPKTAGTEADTAVTFYAVDLTNRVIHAFTYGAGPDRVITWM